MRSKKSTIIAIKIHAIVISIENCRYHNCISFALGSVAIFLLFIFFIHCLELCSTYAYIRASCFLYETQPTNDPINVNVLHLIAFSFVRIDERLSSLFAPDSRQLRWGRSHTFVLATVAPYMHEAICARGEIR